MSLLRSLTPVPSRPSPPHDFGLIACLALSVLKRLRAAGLHAPLTIEATPPTPTQVRQQFEQGQGHMMRVLVHLEHPGYAGDVHLWLPERMVHQWRGQGSSESTDAGRWSGALGGAHVQVEVGLGSVDAGCDGVGADAGG